MTPGQEDHHPQLPGPRHPTHPGVRLERHPPDRLNGWVFRQTQVWVDYWGNEHEIDSMPRDYAAAVIRFCHAQVERILLVCALDAAGEALDVHERACRRRD